MAERGTHCVLVSLLNSQVNKRNNSYAMRINTFCEPSQ